MRGQPGVKGQRSGDTHLDVLGQAAGHVGGQLVADDGTLLEGQQDGGQTLGAAAQQGWVPAAALGGDPAPPCQLTSGTHHILHTTPKACWDDSHTSETHTGCVSIRVIIVNENEQNTEN